MTKVTPDFLSNNRLIGAARGRVFSPASFTTADQVLIFVSTIVILFVIVVMPIAVNVYYSFATAYPLPPEGYSFTADHYFELFANQSLFLELTYESIIYAFGSTLFALIVGLIVAILEIKYLPRTKFRYFMLIPYAIPGVVSVTGWILLLGRGGVINEILMWAFGLSSPPIDIFTRFGMIFVDGLHGAPIAFLLLSPAIRSVPAAVDEAGLIAGASFYQVYRKIIIPLVAPSVLSIFIFIFARNLSNVTVPSVLGIPKQIFTWGSAIPFLFLAGRNLDYSISLAFSTVITIISGILMVYYYRSVSKAEKYTTITGKGGAEPKVYDLDPKKKYLATAFVGGYIFIAAFLPLFIIFLGSIIEGFQFTIDPEFTFRRYTELFAGRAPGVRGGFGRGLKNSLLLGLVVPTVAMSISYLISYSNQSLSIPGAGFLAWLASVPLTIPSISISLAFLITFITTPLYGTMLLVIIAMMARGVPTGMRYTSPGVIKLGKENVEMANICGYNELLTLRKVVVPLTKGDFIAGWMHLFVSSVREVTIPLLLYTIGSEVIGVILLFLLIEGQYKTATVVGVVLVVISTIPYMMLQWYRVRYLDRRPAE